MSIKSVSIRNFTVFKDISINFASGVNVIIGENGTGKTHLLKLMSGHFPQDKISINYSCDQIGEKIFIPAKEMLTHSKGLLAIHDKYGNNMPFDVSLLDIIKLAMRLNLANTPEIGRNILPKLEEIIDGQVVVKEEVFYIQKTNGELIDFSMEAEGIKKFAVLWQLLMNECITENSMLFWDEADSNINPKLLSDVAKILLELSRNGVQVFITSHSYVLAKYLEVLMTDNDDILFHSLFRDDGIINCESYKIYDSIVNNAVRDENIVLYEAELDKVFG